MLLTNEYSTTASGPESPWTRDRLDICLELERVLASRKFRNATGQSRFLKYTVEQTIAGQGHLIREHRIGREGFGRGESFDPRVDPIVRTQARKLRAKLTLYYETRGSDDPIRIELIKGSYIPRFRRRDGSSIEVSEMGAAGESPVRQCAGVSEPSL